MKIYFCSIFWICCSAFFGFLSGMSNGARILFLSPLGSKSHKNFYMSIAEALAEGGHQVTLVSTFNSSKEKENIRDIALPESTNLLFNAEDIFDPSKQTWLMGNLFLVSPETCVKSLASREIQDLKEEQFDLVIASMFFEPCYLSLAHHYKAPLIHGMLIGLSGHLTAMAGEIQLSALSRNLILGEASFPYSFFTRFKSFLLDAAMRAANDYYAFPRSEQLCREAGLCPPDMPSLSDISDSASLVLINSVKTLESPPRPSMPNVIYLGGIHCRPAKPLPIELEEWVSSADHGFILFSLGSVVNPSDMPEKYRQILVKVFGSLKQKVLWMWNHDDMEDLPSNVRLEKWMPQQDLLGHENIKLFITHGGLLSTQEASYHAVPIIGMPIFFDQHFNIADSVSEGWATQMDWENLEEKTFLQMIENVIGNDKYRNVVRRRSKLMRDTPQKPSQVALYWIEYVLRYKGAQHLKSPILKLYAYELYSMDVLAAIAGILLMLSFLLTFFVKFIFRRTFRKKSPKKKND